MGDKKIFVFKIVWRKSIASLHRLTQATQHANLRRTAGDLTWVILVQFFSSGLDLLWNSERKAVETSGLDET